MLSLKLLSSPTLVAFSLNAKNLDSIYEVETVVKREHRTKQRFASLFTVDSFLFSFSKGNVACLPGFEQSCPSVLLHATLHTRGSHIRKIIPTELRRVMAA